MILERKSDFNNGNLNFLGLAVVFGAVGMASFMTASPVEGAAGVSQFYPGRRMVGIKTMPREDPGSITDNLEEEYLPVEQSPWQLLQTAFELIV